MDPGMDSTSSSYRIFNAVSKRDDLAISPLYFWLNTHSIYSTYWFYIYDRFNFNFTEVHGLVNFDTPTSCTCIVYMWGFCIFVSWFGMSGIRKANMTRTLCMTRGGNLAAGAASHLGGSPPLGHTDLKERRGPHTAHAVLYPLQPMDWTPFFLGGP